MFGIERLTQRIERLEAQVRIQEERIRLMSIEQGVPFEAGNSSYQLDSGELSLVHDGKVIHAIKSYRERTGCSLKQAKDAVDAAGRF